MLLMQVVAVSAPGTPSWWMAPQWATRRAQELAPSYRGFVHMWSRVHGLDRCNPIRRRFSSSCFTAWIRLNTLRLISYVKSTRATSPCARIPWQLVDPRSKMMCDITYAVRNLRAARSMSCIAHIRICLPMYWPSLYRLKSTRLCA